MKLISREAARKKGLTRYFDGRVCGNGHTSEKSVRANRCLACRKSSLKRWRVEHPRHRTWNREWARKRRMDVLLRVGGKNLKCKCCGEDQIEFLTIDHKNGDGTTHRKSFGKSKGTPSQFYAWVRRVPLREVRKMLQILCWCCNCSIGSWGYCPHQQESQFKCVGI